MDSKGVVIGIDADGDINAWAEHGRFENGRCLLLGLRLCCRGRALLLRLIFFVLLQCLFLSACRDLVLWNTCFFWRRLKAKIE